MGLSPADVAKLAWRLPAVLARDSAERLQLATAVLEETLGVAPEEVLDMIGGNAPGWLLSSTDTLRDRTAALAEVGSGGVAVAVACTTALTLCLLCFATSN